MILIQIIAFIHYFIKRFDVNIVGVGKHKKIVFGFQLLDKRKSLGWNIKEHAIPGNIDFLI